MGFGNRSRRKGKGGIEERAASGDQVDAEMADMEKDYIKGKEKEKEEEEEEGKSLYISAASTTDTSLSTSRVLNLQSSTGFALVVYIHEAADLDPAAGTGQAVVELTYKRKKIKKKMMTRMKKTMAMTQKRESESEGQDEDEEEKSGFDKERKGETEMRVLSATSDGEDQHPTTTSSSSAAAAAAASLSLVRPLEKFSSKVQTQISQVTSDLGHQLGGALISSAEGEEEEETILSFSTPPSNIHNGFASWGATSRILKISDLKECPSPMILQVKVWQVVGSCSLGTGARVLLGETEWKVDLQDVEVGIHGIHDTELTLCNAWNYEAADSLPSPSPSSSSSSQRNSPVEKTVHHVSLQAIKEGLTQKQKQEHKAEAADDVENRMPVREGFSHVDQTNMPKISLSWRLESLRGKESDEIEMRISKLPYRGHSYAHGGFMGASLSMMGDPQWRQILEELESKKIYLSCKDAWNSGDFQKKMKLMPLLENSPILCAYGEVRSRCTEVASDIPDVAGFEQPLSRVSLSPVIRNESDKSSNVTGSHSHMQASMNMSINMPMDESGEMVDMEMLVREEADTRDSGGMGHEKSSSSLLSTTRGGLLTNRSAGGGMTNRNNWSFLLLGATSETRAQMHWKMFAKRLLKIRRRWRFAIKAVIRQCRISMSWEKSQQRSRVNRYGYSPIPLEWDLWVSPTKPWSVAHATVDHGSQAALVQQAIFTTLGLKRCAGLLGSKHINQKGVPPVQWLTMFGEALNLAVNENKDEPLSFHVDSRIQTFYELEIHLISGDGLVAMDITNTSDPYCKIVVKGDALFRKKEKSAIKFSTLSPQWREELKIWPIDPQAENCKLVIEVWDKDTTSGDDFMGKVEINLDDLELNETSEFYSYPLQPRDGNKTLMTSTGSDLGLGGNNDIGTLTFECKLKEKTVLEAAEEFGIPRHAFQSCLCMLSEPGGIFLDVKSAYSKAKDLALFTTTLTGMGICVKSICSFSPSQLKLPDPCQGVPSQVPTVRFFHGLSGLENACDNGQIRRNDCVFFNGASFLMDTEKGDGGGGMIAMARIGALDTMYVNRYQALSETYHFNGGIYVQETDCCATCVEALTALVSQRPDIFPLGFAYGHVPGFSVSSISMRGRGFAAQQIVEEFQARADLSGKVQKSIALGKHKEVSLSVATSWLERLLYGSNFLYIHEQRLVLQMLGDIHLDTNLSKVIAHVGGVERIFLRFFEHYEATTPFTIHETGFNFNKTKTLCRFLRDHGVLERLPLEKKQKLAKFLTSRSVYGFGMTYIFQKAGFRKSLHKFAKEGMLCLLESCTKMEFDKLVDDIGGMDKAVTKLSGRWKISKSYTRRLKAIQDCHDAYPYDPQYIADMTIQRASAVNRSRESRFHKNRSVTFDKKLRRAAKDTALKTRKIVRKSTCCVFTGLYVAALTFFSFTLFAWVYGLPRTLWPYWGKTWNKQRIKGILIIIGMLLLSAGLTLGVGAIVWFFIFRL